MALSIAILKENANLPHSDFSSTRINIFGKSFLETLVRPAPDLLATRRFVVKSPRSARVVDNTGSAPADVPKNIFLRYSCVLEKSLFGGTKGVKGYFPSSNTPSRYQFADGFNGDFEVKPE